MGAVRSKTKTEVIFMVGAQELEEKKEEWDVEAIGKEAVVRTADEGVLTLGVVTGPKSKVEEQIRTKAKVLGQIHRQVEVVDDAQAEHIMAKESMGTSRVNHILRVHGNALSAGGSLRIMDEAARKTQDRLFPGISEDGYIQAGLGVQVGGLGWKRAEDTANGANAAAWLSAWPLVSEMIEQTKIAGLIQGDALAKRAEKKMEAAIEGYLGELDEAENIKAREYLVRARKATAGDEEGGEGGEGGARLEAPSLGYVSRVMGDVITEKDMSHQRREQGGPLRV